MIGGFHSAVAGDCVWGRLPDDDASPKSRCQEGGGRRERAEKLTRKLSTTVNAVDTEVESCGRSSLATVPSQPPARFDPGGQIGVGVIRAASTRSITSNRMAG